MAQYSDGTVTVTNGSATVTGSATAWLANASSSDRFVALGIAGEDVSYEIASVDDDETIQLTAPFAGTTGGSRSYTIHRDFFPNSIPKFNRSDAAPHAILNRMIERITELLAGGNDAEEIDDLTAIAGGDLDTANDSLIVHDASADEAKKLLLSGLPAGTPADGSITNAKLATDAKRFPLVARTGAWASSQAQADAGSFNLWSAGTLTVNTLAAGSVVMGRNTSGGTLSAANGTASINNGITSVLAGEAFMLVFEATNAASLVTKS